MEETVNINELRVFIRKNVCAMDSKTGDLLVAVNGRWKDALEIFTKGETDNVQKNN